MKRFLFVWLVLIVAFVMVMPAVALANTGESLPPPAITWAGLVPLGFIVLACVDALKKEFKEVSGHELGRLWVIAASFLVGAVVAVLNTYWTVLPTWSQLALGGGALGLTVSGVIKLGDYGADAIAKARSAPKR